MNFDDRQNEIERLEDEMFDLLDEMNDIKSQLESAKANAAINGDYSNKDWFHKATFALRKKQSEHQRGLKRLGRMNRELKQEKLETQSKEREKIFVEVVRQMSTREEFLAIWDKVDIKLSA